MIKIDFEYTGCLTVESRDLHRMFLLYKNKGYTPAQAVAEISAEWDDCDYCIVGYVTNDICAEITRRLEQSRKSKMNF